MSNSVNLSFLNVLTFCADNKKTVIDLTLPSRPIDPEIYNWRIAPVDTLSDRRNIQFILRQDKQPTLRRRSIKHTNWYAYNQELNAETGLWFGSQKAPIDIVLSPDVKCFCVCAVMPVRANGLGISLGFTRF